MEFITCEICKVRKRELNGHLRMHQISSNEYRTMFPNAPMISEASSARKSKSLVAAKAINPPQPVSEKTRLKISEATKAMHARQRKDYPLLWLARQQKAAQAARAAKGDGYKHSQETLEKMRRPRLKTRGVKKTEDHRRKLSEVRKGRKFQPHAPETIEKMREAWRRRKQNKKQYEEYIKAASERMSSSEMVTKLRDRFATLIREGNHNGKSKDTSIENRFKRYLDTSGIEFEHQYTLPTQKGSFTFDFFIPSLNMLVEVDGEYWHTKSLEVWNRDKLKERLATEQGFVVTRISDKDWKPEMIHSSLEIIQEHNKLIFEHRYQLLTQTEE